LYLWDADQEAKACDGPISAQSAKPEILVISDSIGIGYRPFLQENFPQFSVLGLPCSAKTTKFTLRHIDAWLAQRPSFKAIVWNNGLWDIMQNGAGLVTPINDYKKNLFEIGEKIKNKTDHPLFVLTTDVPANVAARHDADVVIYNAAASEVMAELGIPVLDLHKTTSGNPSLHQDSAEKDDVHFTPQGYERLGAEIANKIKPC
jgi:hypothetical protein